MDALIPGSMGAEVRNGVRTDIQGLRAIAVLSVMVFHAGLPMPGGFIGVDVFFVISGFVITAMLLRERKRSGTISLRRFYLRRFKRLTPALAVMVTVTVLISMLLFSPFDQQVVTAQTAVGAMLIVANWVIAATTGGYFDLAAKANPLLHTWSLSVEEQFYIFFPTVLLITLLIGSRWTRFRWLPIAAVAGIALVSIAGTLYALRSVEISNGALLGFYSTVNRAWEFAAGAILALMADRILIKSSKITTALGAIGIALLAVSFFGFSETTSWPGPATVVPVLGTVLLIVAGSGARNLFSRALSVRPMVTIGNLSYSLYLWHWPFIVFAIAIWPFSPVAALVAAVLSVLPAVASYRWIEQPFRNSRLVGARRIAPAVAGFVLVPTLIAGAALWAAPNVLVPVYESGRFGEVLEGNIDVLENNEEVEQESFPCTPPEIYQAAPVYAGFTRCRQSQPGDNVTVALLGDSHAEHLYPGFADALPDQNVAMYIGDFLPVRGSERMDRILDYLVASTTVHTVIVSVNWLGKPPDPAGLTAMTNELLAAGKRVFISDDSPTFGFGPFGCKFSQGLLLGKLCDMDADRFWPLYDAYMEKLDDVTAAAPGSELLHVAQYFCDEETCSMRRGDQVLFRDVNHVNDLGSDYIAESLLRDNPSLAGFPPPQG